MKNSKHTPGVFLIHRYVAGPRQGYKTGWTVSGVRFKPGSFYEERAPWDWNVFPSKRDAKKFARELNVALVKIGKYISIEAAIDKAEGKEVK